MLRENICSWCFYGLKKKEIWYKKKKDLLKIFFYLYLLHKKYIFFFRVKEFERKNIRDCKKTTARRLMVKKEKWRMRWLDLEVCNSHCVIYKWRCFHVTYYVLAFVKLLKIGFFWQHSQRKFLMNPTDLSMKKNICSIAKIEKVKREWENNKIQWSISMA